MKFLTLCLKSSWFVKFIIEKSGVEKLMVEMSGVENSWLKILGLKLGDEKSGVEMSFNSVEYNIHL